MHGDHPLFPLDIARHAFLSIAGIRLLAEIGCPREVIGDGPSGPRGLAGILDALEIPAIGVKNLLQHGPVCRRHEIIVGFHIIDNHPHPPARHFRVNRTLDTKLIGLGHQVVVRHLRVHGAVVADLHVNYIDINLGIGDKLDHLLEICKIECDGRHYTRMATGWHIKTSGEKIGFSPYR